MKFQYGDKVIYKTKNDSGLPHNSVGIVVADRELSHEDAVNVFFPKVVRGKYATWLVAKRELRLAKPTKKAKK